MKDQASDLGALIGELAARHRLGTVGLAGSIARGEECPGADIDVIVTVPLRMAERFAAAQGYSEQRIEPDEVVHVGVRDEDIAGAQQAGRPERIVMA